MWADGCSSCDAAAASGKVDFLLMMQRVADDAADDADSFADTDADADLCLMLIRVLMLMLVLMLMQTLGVASGAGEVRAAGAVASQPPPIRH